MMLATDPEQAAEALGRSLLRPARARLAEAVAVAKRAGDAPSCWEQMARAGLLPVGWLATPRAYLDVPDSGLYIGSNVERLPRRLAHPPTLRACAAVGAEVAGVERAEADVRALVKALRPWGAKSGPVVWDIVVPDGAIPKSLGWPGELNIIQATAEEAVRHDEYAAGRGWDNEALGKTTARFSALSQRVVASRPMPGIRTLFAECMFKSWLWWHLARDRGLTAPRELDGGDYKTRKAVWKQPLAELPDPFVPLWRLLSAGFSVAELDADVSLLVLPRIDAETLGAMA